MMQLKRIAFEIDERSKKLKFASPFIEANGTKYFWADSISFDRITHYEALVPQLATGMTLNELFNTFKTIWTLGNDQNNEDRYGLIQVHAYNAMKGIAAIEDEARIPIVFEMVSLFLNAEDEDIGLVDRRMIQQKYNDIRKERYDPQDFFALAMAFMPAFIQIYKEVTRDTFLNRTKEEIAEEQESQS